jgi:hypothetical protein
VGKPAGTQVYNHKKKPDLKGVFSQNLFKATLQGKTRLFKAKSPGALQGKIAWRPSRRNRLAPLRGGVVFGSNS